MDPKAFSFSPCSEDERGVVLADDRCRITVSGDAYEVDAQIVYRPHEFPSAQLELADLHLDVTEEIDVDSCYLVSSGLALEQGRLSSIEQHQRPSTSRFSHRVRQTEPMILACDTSVTQFSALVYNLGRFSLSLGPSNGREQLRLDLPDGWTATIGPVGAIGTPETLRRLNTPWRALTNSLQLSRTNLPPASTQELHDVVYQLQYFLSFAWGRFVGIACGQGFSPENDLVYAMPGTTPVEPRTLPLFQDVHWFPFQASVLQSLVSGFWAKATDPLWKDCVEWAVYWWLIANKRTQASESSLLASQSGLESLAFHILTKLGKQERKQIPQNTAGKIRAMLKVIQAPLPVPAQLGELAALASSKSWDGPTAVTEVRNSLAHPSKGSEAGCAFEASQLAMWYLEMVLLFVFDYRGQIRNRTSRGAPLFEVEAVPWAKHTADRSDERQP